MERPIFISGLRKSGTSLVKNLLDDHPELFAYPPNELELFHHSHHPAAVANKRESGAYEADPTKLLRIVADIDYVQGMKDDGLPNDYSRQVDIEGFNAFIADQGPESYADVYEALFRGMALAAPNFDGDTDDVRFTSKTVLETEHFPYLLDWFPEVKFVYVLRNPYGHFSAARTSMRKMDGTEEDAVSLLRDPYPFLGSELRRMELSYYFMRKYRDLYPDQFHVLVFDRLLQDPEAELRELASFLDIEYHENMTNPTICGQPWGGNSYKVEEFEGIDTRPLHHWKDDISRLEVRVINDPFDDIIADYGFDRINSDTSLLRPFNLAERPHTYLANRVAYLWQKHGTA